VSSFPFALLANHSAAVRRGIGLWACSVAGSRVKCNPPPGESQWAPLSDCCSHFSWRRWMPPRVRRIAGNHAPRFHRECDHRHPDAKSGDAWPCKREGTMKRLLLLPVAVIVAIVAALQGDPWAPVCVFGGSWEGTVTGKPGKHFSSRDIGSSTASCYPRRIIGLRTQARRFEARNSRGFRLLQLQHNAAEDRVEAIPQRGSRQRIQVGLGEQRMASRLNLLRCGSRMLSRDRTRH
jgi:hypothetical protein